MKALLDINSITNQLIKSYSEFYKEIVGELNDTDFTPRKSFEEYKKIIHLLDQPFIQKYHPTHFVLLQKISDLLTLGSMLKEIEDEASDDELLEELDVFLSETGLDELVNNDSSTLIDDCYHCMNYLNSQIVGFYYLQCEERNILIDSLSYPVNPDFFENNSYLLRVKKNETFPVSISEETFPNIVIKDFSTTGKTLTYLYDGQWKTSNASKALDNSFNYNFEKLNLPRKVEDLLKSFLKSDILFKFQTSNDFDVSTRNFPTTILFYNNSMDGLTIAIKMLDIYNQIWLLTFGIDTFESFNNNQFLEDISPRKLTLMALSSSSCLKPEDITNLKDFTDKYRDNKTINTWIVEYINYFKN